MNGHRFHRLDRDTAELLLRGGVASPAAHADPVAGLLAAASAPARDRELADEARVVAAFRLAHLHPIPQPRRSPMSVTKLLIAKAALASLGLSGGGVALAAVTGHLHAGVGGSVAAGTVGASASAVAASSSSDGRTPSGSHPSASPSPSLRGLCHAYMAGVGSNPGKALDNPAFAALIRAAGGKGGISAYCASLLASKPGQGQGQKQTSHGHGKEPGDADHPTGKPTSHP